MLPGMQINLPTFSKLHSVTARTQAAVAVHRFVNFAGVHAAPGDNVQGVSEAGAAAGQLANLITSYSALVECAAPVTALQSVGPAPDGTGRAVPGGLYLARTGGAVGELIEVVLAPGLPAPVQGLVSADGIRLLGGVASRPRLLIMGNSIAGQSCRAGALYTSKVAAAAGSGIKPGSNQITLATGGVAALSLTTNDYIVVQLANQQPWPVQVTAIAGEVLTLAKRLPFTVRTVSGSEAGVSKVTAPVLFGGSWRQQFGIHNLANALAGGLFEVVPGYGHGSATALDVLGVLPQHLEFYRPAVVMLSLFENAFSVSTPAQDMIDIADRAAGLCLAAGARPIILHSLPTTSVGASLADEYDDLRTAILNIGSRVPGAIGVDPGGIYLDTSNGTNPRRPLSGWTDGVVHPIESKRATIALDGGLVAALQSCAQGQAPNIPAMLHGANPKLAGTGGTAGGGTTGTVAASTTISCSGTGLSAVAAKNADDSQRVTASDAGAVTAGTEVASVAQTYTLPVSWGFRTRVKLMAEVTVHSQTNLGALRIATAFGSQDVDLRTSASSSEPFDSALVGRKIVLESMPVPVLDPSVTSATITLSFRTITATGFDVDATVHSLGFALASCGEIDDGAIALL